MTWYHDAHRSRPKAGSFYFACCPDFTIMIDFEPDNIGSAAYGAIFHVGLEAPRRNIDRHNDRFTAALADVAGLILHGSGAAGMKFPFNKLICK